MQATNTQLKRNLIIVVAIAVVCAAGAWMISSRKLPPNLLLISLDTTRADHLSCYKPGRKITPRIDALAAESVLFEQAISPKPLTLPAHSSMMTGKYPPCHGVHDNISFKLADSHITLAEVLKENGYHTGAVVGAFILDAKFGLAQGFDFYDDDMDARHLGMEGFPERRAEAVTKSAGEWLERNSSAPFFLFVHYYDPHHDYSPPEPYASMFADDLYSGEIAYTDHCVGVLVDVLKEKGLYENTLIVLVGDHGEGLGDHAESKHGYFVYRSTTWVPMIVKPAAKASPRRVTTNVSLVDVMPTVLSQAGLTTPEELSDARDLSPLWKRGDPPGEERYVYSESMTATVYGCSPLLAVEGLEWKYIHSAKPELYHLAADPDETINLVERESRRAGFMRYQLETVIEPCRRASHGESVLHLDPQSLARLRAMGYVGGGTVVELDLAKMAGKEDPKDFLPIFTKIESIEYHVAHQDFAKAKNLCAEVAAERPDIAYVHSVMAHIAIQEGDDEAGIGHYRRALELKDTRADWHSNLGNALQRVGRLEEATAHYLRALELALAGANQPGDPDHPTAPRASNDPLLADVHSNFGSLRLRQGNCEDALRHYEQSCQMKPAEPMMHYSRGVALRKCGRTEEAEAAFRKTLELDPNHTAANRALGLP